MTTLFHALMPPVGEGVDWAKAEALLPFRQALQDCRQDPRHHAEGDVWTHTKMVVDALLGLKDYQDFTGDDRFIAFTAALLHDIAKPSCTVQQPDGSITSHSHSPRGAIDARILLWKMGVPFAVREQICRIIATHQQPFHLFSKEHPEALVHRLSCVVRTDLLAAVAMADSLGRRCADSRDWQKSIDHVALFRDLCIEENCLGRPRRFASEHTRYLYFRDLAVSRTVRRSPDYPAHENHRCVATIMSGLPGSGKDSWVKANCAGMPVVSLDAIRDAERISPEDDQGAVIQAAREQAREHLRRGEDFVWNATNLSRQNREKITNLLADYEARIEIVYLEAEDTATAQRQNHSRDGLLADGRARGYRDRDQVVPQHVIERMMLRWEPPLLTEAHAVRYEVGGREINLA